MRIVLNKWPVANTPASNLDRGVRMRHRIEHAVLPRRREVSLSSAPGIRQSSVFRQGWGMFADSLYCNVAIAAGLLWLVLRAL